MNLVNLRGRGAAAVRAGMTTMMTMTIAEARGAVRARAATIEAAGGTMTMMTAAARAAAAHGA